MTRALFVTTILLLTACVGLHGPRTESSRVQILPENSSLDANSVVVAEGFASQSVVTLRMALLANGVEVAASSGVVSTNGQGRFRSEAILDQLLWSMPSEADSAWPRSYRLTATDDVGHSAISEVTRFVVDAGTTEVANVSDNGVIGVLYSPQNGARQPGVIVLGGSEGGVPEIKAALLSGHSYTVLALGYFGLSGVPETLEDIPLEYLNNAVTWLRSRADCDGRVFLVGGSKGAEYALTFASYRPGVVNGVVAIVPSHAVWNGIGSGGPPIRSSWTLAGQELPFAQTLGPNAGDPPDPHPIRARYERPLTRGLITDQMLIPVGRIDVPMLLISAGDDGIWPSQEMAEQIVAAMRTQHKGDLVEHQSFQSAGHTLSIPYMPLGPMGTEARMTGGVSEATGPAAIAAWRRTLVFLETHTRRR